MKFAQLLFSSTSLLVASNAHYLFGRLIFDNHWTRTFEYVRQITGAGGRNDTSALLVPNEDPESTDIVCGRSATRAWNRPKTAKIRAGATVGFAPGEPMLPDDDSSPRIYHQGVASAWLSKSPVDDLDDYEGDGDWFKIMSVVGRTEQSLDFSLPEFQKWDHPDYTLWGTYRADSWNFTIPATTPPGKYLLRFEHLYPNMPFEFASIRSGAQFYPNCAHVEIMNDNPIVGTPGPLVKIPGVYEFRQPDIYISLYNDFNFTNFKAPTPEVWQG